MEFQGPKSSLMPRGGRETMSMVQAWILAGILVSMAGTGLAVETSNATGTTVIVGDERWQDDERTLTERVVLAPGASLTVEDSQLTIDRSQECTPVRVNGNYCAPDIHVLAGAELVLERVELVHLSHPISETVAADAGGIIIQDSTIEGAGPILVQGPGGSLTMVGSEVTDMEGEVAVFRGADGLIEGNTFEGIGSTVGAQDASPTIHANMFTGVDEAIRAQASIVGEKAFSTAPTITENTFVGGGTGVFTDSGYGVTIEDNTFVDQEYRAISHRIPVQDGLVHWSPATITGNIFEDQHKVLNVYTPGHSGLNHPVTVEMHQNSIDAWCVYISASAGPNAPLTVDATDNWWGSSDGPQDPDGSGCSPFIEEDAQIEFDPWLEDAPEA